MTAQTQLRSYSEQQRAFGNSNICNLLSVWRQSTYKMAVFCCFDNRATGDCVVRCVLRVLRAVLKHVPSWNMFQIGMACRFEKCAFLKHVSDWHRANFVISRADDNMSFLTITFEVALATFVTEKQTNKEMQPGLTFGLFSLMFMLQDHAFIMRLRYDERSLHGANLKHGSEMHIFQNGTPCQSETCFRMARVIGCVMSDTYHAEWEYLQHGDRGKKGWQLIVHVCLH